MKKAVVILVFRNVEHIIKSLDSIIVDDSIDYYIIENPSENTKAIEDYIKTKNVKSYIRFSRNTWGSSFHIFLKHFDSIFTKYSYISFTDGDLYFIDFSSAYSEVIANLEKPNVCVSSVDLCVSNLPDRPNSENWLNVGKITDGYCEKSTGIHLLTIKGSFFRKFRSVKFVDSNIAKLVKALGLKWAATINNKPIHLTWDLYKDGNPYLQFKVNNSKKKSRPLKDCDFKIII